MPDPSQYTGPVVVTLLLLLLYYGFMIRQAVVKTALARSYAARGEKFDRYFGQDREMLAADRSLLNLGEHLAPFLTLLWLHALFVDPTSATAAGAVYLVARVAYPFLLGRRLGRGIPARILVATVLGYLVLAYLMGRIALTLLS